MLPAKSKNEWFRRLLWPQTEAMTSEAWQKAGRVAIQTRDASIDGHLWYGVLSTGIYCRPSCPSPAAKSEHLRFFRTPAQAVEAGFRACKRCLPDQIQPYPTWLMPAVEQLGQGVSPGQCAQNLNIAPATLSRGFQRWLGVQPKAFVDFCLTQHFMQLRARGHGVLEAAMMAGFGSEAGMRRGVVRWLGLSPSEQHQACELSWGLTAMPLGWLGVALSPRGVAFAGLGQTPGEVLADLAQRFPNAYMEPMSDACGEALSQIAQRQLLNLPLDLDGTSFRMRVWQALQQIPAGQPLHYAELAQQIGAPKAARAVGSACAANPVCLSVPCHRVIPASGGLGGYRWGQWRKAWLLETES